MSRPLGGYIGHQPVPASAGFNSAAGGIWTLRDAQRFKQGGTWPTSTATITISSQPSNQTASSGAATFSVAASVSAGTLTYQWERQALGAGAYSPISGATSASLALTGLTNAANNADNYRVVVSATGATSLTSNSAALTVAASAALLSIARNNGSSTFTGSGTAASPFVRAAGWYWDAADGLSHYSWTATGSATVTFTYYFNDDTGDGYGAYITKNGARAGADNTGGTVTRTFSVVSGDVIAMATYVGSSMYFSDVSVSAA